MSPQWRDLAEAAERRYGVTAPSYQDLHAWSVDQPEQFWALVWQECGVVASRAPDRVLADASMPRAQWFPGARLNYVDTVLRHRDRPGPAVVTIGEDGERQEISWPELADRVGAVAQWLREQGVDVGDRVVGYLPNAGEAMVAFLAAAAVGATWAGCAPDYGAAAAADRLAQLRPTVLVAVAGYRFGGKVRDRRDVVGDLAGRLGVRVVVGVDREGLALHPDHLPVPVVAWDAVLRTAHPDEPVTEQLPPDHPLWVLFSSGTTGVPKGIVHGHAGVVTTHLMVHAMHLDLRAGDVLFWYTTPNWMMWNLLAGALLVGVTAVTYEGSPAVPGPDRLWQITHDERVTVLGTSPGHLQMCADAGVEPGRDRDLSALRQIGVTGAPTPARLNTWVAEHVGPDVPLGSVSGGTDVVSAFIGAVPDVPVVPGRISVPILGVAADAWDSDGRPVLDTVGELVVTRPTPSMPVRFWNDPDGSRYRGAYFDTYPGVWRHGDWVTRHSDGGWTVHGRSDSTLNRNGVRLGSAELYAVVEADPQVAEALVLGVERANGTYRMPMFLVPAAGTSIDDATVDRLRERLRTEVSPRHVPDEFHVVAALPHTRTGKKLEVPLKRILQGAAPDTVLSSGAVDDFTLVDMYVDLARRWDTEERTAPTT